MFQAFQATGQPIITTLLKPNFLTNKWDGDLRLAFQFIPFAQNLLDQAGLSYILDLFTTPYLVRPDHSYDLVAMDTRNRAQQTQAYYNDHIAWQDELRANEAARLMVELQHGLGAILPAVPDAVAFAAAIAAIGPDRIEPVLNLPPPNAGALELGNIKKYETDLAKQKIDADKAKAIIEDHLGPNMLTQIKPLSQQPIPPGFTQRHKVIQIWAYLLQFTQENTKIIDDIRADFVKIPQVHSWAEAHEAVSVCNYLNLELRTMGAQHVKPDMELITIMNNIMVAECFQAIKYQVLAGNPHRQTLATAPLLGAPMQPAHNQFQMAVAAGFQQLGIAFNPAHLAFQLQPAMTWATFSQSIQDHMTLDPKHGVHSALSIRSQPTVNAASVSNPSSTSSSSSSSSSYHDSGPEPKRQHREPDGTAYAANAAPSYDELQAKVAAYERQAQPYNGRYQYPPQNQPQPPRYHQFQQNQQYRQKGPQIPPRFHPKGG